MFPKGFEPLNEDRPSRTLDKCHCRAGRPEYGETTDHLSDLRDASGLLADRIAGRHRRDRGADRPVAAGGAVGPGSGAAGSLRIEPPADRPGDPFLSRDARQPAPRSDQNLRPRASPARIRRARRRSSTRGVLIFILPGMEQPGLYDAVNQDLTIAGRENRTVHATAVGSYACPSDPGSGAARSARSEWLVDLGLAGPDEPLGDGLYELFRLLGIVPRLGVPVPDDELPGAGAPGPAVQRRVWRSDTDHDVLDPRWPEQHALRDREGDRSFQSTRCRRSDPPPRATAGTSPAILATP